MENQIQILDNNQQLANSDLPNKILEIGTIIYDVSHLRSYPLTENQIEDWAKTIDRLFPDLKIERLRKVVDDFLLGRLRFDQRDGIQNITSELSTAPKMVY